MGQKILRMTPSLLTNILKGLREGEGTHYRVVDYPLPQDARVLRSYFDPEHGWDCIVIESAEYEETPPSERLPFVDPPVIHVHFIEDENAKEAA